MNYIDKFLNNITMYRLVLYGLLVLAFYSFALSFMRLLDFKPLELLTLIVVLLVVCFLGNLLLARLFKATVNTESSLITALILYFLLWPSFEFAGILTFFAAGTIAMVSKYVIVFRKKHLFNPATIGAVFLIILNSGALWWVATPLMLPLTLVIGLLIVRKIRRFTMFFTFITVTLLSFLIQVQMRGLNLVDETYQFFVSFPVIFFGTVMLTEPLTTPPTKKLQLIYASIVGVLFSYQGSFGPLILTTELVLIFGNVFSFLVSPKYKLYLNLVRKNQIAKNTYEFSFPKPPDFKFRPGQYLEWTLPMTKTDSRGNRRYFTIASSPTESELKLGVRFNEPKSMFKQKLLDIINSEKILAGQLMGDFTLPYDSTKKLVFISGGIGVTPFRSMIKFLVDNKEKRDIVFFYSNKSEDEIAYKDLFDEAEKKVGIRFVYILTDEKNTSSILNSETKRIDEQMLKKYVGDFDTRTFYLSGPNSMVENYKKLLKKMGIKSSLIKTDYFPGF